MHTNIENLEIDAKAFASNFAQRSFPIRHRLQRHPLLTFEAVARLADRLPSDQARRERGNLALVDRGYVDFGSGSPSATISAIANNGSRVSLREIQDDHEYGPLIRESHETITRLVRTREGGIRRRSGYIFVTSPQSTTPMHFDPEHSFLLQINGTKRVSVAPMDRLTRTSELERYLDGQPCAFDVMKAECDTFVLEPGDGLYLPSFVPHWVEQTGEEPSISFSLPFYTRDCERADQVHRFNKRLRRLHLAPRPPGLRPSVDRVKATLLQSWTTLRGNRARAGT